MMIKLTKGIADWPGTLTCIRDDGSSTWQHSTSYFAWHDLIHCAVETTLGYTEAFFGLVNAGKGLDDFGTRNGKRDAYTCQEAWAEQIVGLLQWPGAGGGADLTDEQFLQQLGAVLADSACPAPDLSVEQLHAIKARMYALHGAWAKVPEGETMELRFP